jgi:murein DD-endopeptidase MepM/ murein hydrolase activator NlpD
MILKLAILGVTLAMLVVLPVDAGQPTTPLERGRMYTAWFYAGETAALWGLMSAELRQSIGSEEALRALRADLTAQLGAEQQVIDETVTQLLRYHVYARTAAFEKSAAPVELRWSFDANGMIAGFFIRPAQAPAPSRFLEYETRTHLRLPFDGAWYVFWGGRSVIQNYHAVATDQRFAYDFLVERDQRTHEGDGTANEQYFCFGRPVLAPGDGEVVAAVDGIPENQPGVMNPEQPLGNHVIIDHGNGEFSFLAHLQTGSVAVAAGERVAAGAQIGRCGNSGNSSEPHLHYHLQTTPDAGRGEGLPAQFQSYLADGVHVDRGEPKQGQTVENAN